MKAADTLSPSTDASSSQHRPSKRRPKATVATREIIALASARCEQMGLRLTPLRRDLLETLASEAKPLGAYDIAERLGTRLERRLAPTIAYRGLDFLVDIGLVTRLESQNSYVLCAYPDCPHDCMFLVCTSCDWVEEIVDQDVATRLENVAMHAGFVTERRVIEIQGQCKACRPAEGSLVLSKAEG